MSTTQVAWLGALAQVIDASHLVTGEEVSAMTDLAVQPLGLRAEVLVADLAQRELIPVHPHRSTAVKVEGTVAGRVFQTGEILAATDEQNERLLWVPMLDGTDRAGVLRVELAPAVIDDPDLRRCCWTLAGLVGHITIGKMPYSERLRWLRGNGPLTPAAELLWQLLPPRTFANERLVVTALLEPHDEVAGDAYDYAVNVGNAYLAVFDGVGHDLQAGQTTAVAVTAIRQARRAGQTDLLALAAHADEMIAAQPGPTRFVSAVLATLDTDTGLLHYVLAGHPPPLLVRGRRTVKELDHPPRLPLGLRARGTGPPSIGREQLEPGDRLLLYSDGITEARNPHGEFFGEQRLIDFTERAELDRLPAPETLRRLGMAILTHQRGRLQDDATLLMADWSADAHRRLFPTFR